MNTISPHVATFRGKLFTYSHGSKRWVTNFPLSSASNMTASRRGCSHVTSPGNERGRRGAFRKIREFWRGPTFKYWFIGGTAFSGWLAYYSLKAYKKTRIEVNLPPSLPSHYLVTREGDLQSIDAFLKSTSRVGGRIRVAAIQGPTGFGKSLLAYNFAKREIANSDKFKFSLPKSRVAAFLNASSMDTFLPCLKAFGSKLNIKNSDIRETCSEREFSELPFHEKCDVLLGLIQDRLKKHPNWVIVIDNLLSTTPQEIRSIVAAWFLDDEKGSEWSNGTLLLTDDDNQTRSDYKEKAFKMKGLNSSDAEELMKEMVNLSDTVLIESSWLPKLFTLAHGNALALTCASIVLKHRLQEQPLGSVDSQIQLLCREVEKHVRNVMNSSGLATVTQANQESRVLVTVEVLIAMAWNVMKTKNPYVVHCIDLLSNCRPGLPIPALLVSRHLKNPSFQLLPIQPGSVSPGLNQIFNKNKGQDSETELEPIGRPLSNRRIVNWLYSIEDWFKETWQVMRELYDLYKGTIDIPEEDDGLAFLRECELVLTKISEPGGVKSFQLHPCVYMVARQNLLSYTAPLLENTHLASEQWKYTQLPWYKKMQPFDPTLAIQQFRNKLGVQPEHISILPTMLKAYSAPLLDLGPLLVDKNQMLRCNFESDGVIGRFLHVQAHLGRVLSSFADTCHVSPETLPGKTTSKFMASHLEYIIQSHPREFIRITSQISSLQSLAHVSLTVDKDVQTTRSLYLSVLELQQKVTPEGSLDTAHTLMQIANLETLSDGHEKAKELLEQAVETYESHRKKVGEYQRPYEFGRCLALLGVVCGSLGEKQRSKELIERGLMLQQVGAPDMSDPQKGKKFGAEFAVSLTDLGHAYIAIGLPLYGRKILDLALAAHKNIHGETHPEVSRTLTLLSVAHLMQGHNEESRKLRREAGKINAGIEGLPLY